MSALTVIAEKRPSGASPAWRSGPISYALSDVEYRIGLGVGAQRIMFCNYQNKDRKSKLRRVRGSYDKLYIRDFTKRGDDASSTSEFGFGHLVSDSEQGYLHASFDLYYAGRMTERYEDLSTEQVALLDRLILKKLFGTFNCMFHFPNLENSTRR